MDLFEELGEEERIFSFDEEFEAEVVFDFGIARGDSRVDVEGLGELLEEDVVKGLGSF